MIKYVKLLPLSGVICNSKKKYAQSIFGSFFCTQSNDYVHKIILENNYNNIRNLKSQELRVLSENCCVKKINDVIIWSEISRNAIEKCNEFKYFDALLLLSSFEKMNILDRHLYKSFSDVFIKQINHLEPRHFILLINLYCKANIFPRILFIQVFHSIIKYCSKLYPEEYVDMLTCFANLKIVNKDLIKTLCKSIIKNINLFDYLHLCSIVGCLRALDINDEVFYYVVDEKQLKELKLLTVQEIFDHIKKIKLLTYSWELYEKDLIKEFLTRINEFKNEKDVNQLDDPFICLNYLISKNYISNNYLLALSKWCATHVYEYPSKSAKRPLSYQLIKLYELMKEKEVGNYDFIEKAIYRFVISRGGLAVNRDKMVRAVSYQKGRKYVFTSDPLADQAVIRSSVNSNASYNDDHHIADHNNGNSIIYDKCSNDENYTKLNAQDNIVENTKDYFNKEDYYVQLKEHDNITEKQRRINLSFEKKTERKKNTHSNSRYCNFKLRQRPKRIKNKALPAQV
ncbi:heptatricopeptide repeat-containing protein HPR1 [Plasmodium brasilianum]|uniref:RNA-editing substrate-binding complex 6 protein domain-containing protein n=2 Tax=Plasmodium (Plasmodium) TaxID=418103 RepID=A0A1D3RJ21_PLAMA|nr:conserved Plasmodium protein, unknown function [Plasmodium malariae]KAI4837971.1 heptatricopeptide repeat-containing protein HPR1 [Plasmodium brasilianum]SCN45180.1 conserved Plasmodium protein, unknown function [Plasmodium malariae]